MEHTLPKLAERKTLIHAVSLITSSTSSLQKNVDKPASRQPNHLESFHFCDLIPAPKALETRAFNDLAYLEHFHLSARTSDILPPSRTVLAHVRVPRTPACDTRHTHSKPNLNQPRTWLPTPKPYHFRTMTYQTWHLNLHSNHSNPFHGIHHHSKPAHFQ